MKKYSFLIEAFPSNYWKNTYANFEYIDSSDNVMDLINKTKKEKYTPDFKSESNSYYLISPNKRYLIRISDHWSDSNISSIKCVGNIGSCYWKLTSKKVVKDVKKYQMGIVCIQNIIKNTK